MNYRYLQSKILTLGLTVIAASAVQDTMAAPPAPLNWLTVVNNGDFMPTNTCDPTAANLTTPPCKTFNSYNQPSVNAKGLVVFRARSKGGEGGGGGEGETVAEIAGDGGSEGGNQPVHGVYTRNMAANGPLVKILDRNTEVPQPNNAHYSPANLLLTTFIEPPSFPRIDIGTNTIATRGNHQPVWEHSLPDNSETRAGTTGIYTNPFGSLITGASKLGSVLEFSFFQVPEVPGTPFDVFPGAPAVTDGTTIVFKGNYTAAGSKTGVYYRDLVNTPIPLTAGNSLAPAGGSNPVVLIANNTDTLIPGTASVFGSTAPPSAAGRQAVFTGFVKEEDPIQGGGIYLAPLTGPTPPLTTLVSIDSRVPGENSRATFNKLGEGLSFDGRFVAFWGAWGGETKTIVLQCRAEGNAGRVAYCNQQHPNGFATTVPVHQGIFVHDTKTKATIAVAKTPTDFDDFVYWNFSGRTPGTGEGDDDGELARWRSASFVAVSGMVDGSLTDATFHAAFKARSGEVVNGAYIDPMDGIYLRKGPGQSQILTVVETGMNGTLLDTEAIDPETSAILPITEMGIERDGFRGNSLVVNVSMGTEEAGWAGIYLTHVAKP